MMLPEKSQQKLIGELDIFIEYGVTDSEKDSAKKLVEKYKNNSEALEVLLEFYRVLPETREEAVVKIQRLDTIQGVILLALTTANHVYNAVVSEGQAQILGEFNQDEVPADILQFFGHGTNDEFVKSYSPIEEQEELAVEIGEEVCPACQVAVGQVHVLGCPVEICPWCDGQLNKCNCRFEKLDVESLESNAELDQFQELLETKGRIPYKPEQKPAYPGTSDGLDS